MGAFVALGLTRKMPHKDSVADFQSASLFTEIGIALAGFGMLGKHPRWSAGLAVIEMRVAKDSKTAETAID